MGCIYLVRNLVNGKGYVGKTIGTLRQRMISHLKAAINGSKTVFYQALRKYGPDTFEWKVVIETNDGDELNEVEVLLIQRWGTKAPNGYNMTDGGTGGDTFSGRHHTEEAKQKIREARTPEIIERVAAFHRGRKRSLKTKLAISEATKGRKAWNKGKKQYEHVVQAVRKAHLGKKTSEETKRKISESSKGKPKSAEHCAKIGRAHKGRVRSAEHCRKLSLAMKGKPAWNKGKKGKKQTPEQLAANIERAKYRKRDVLGRLLPKEKAS